MPCQDIRTLTVSFTSYPARIQYVPAMLSTLLNQTRPADRIVLYLSEDQFPERDAALPETLQNAQKEKQLQIRWVPGDLKPHKKYYYAFREFPEDIIVTVDDDVLYMPKLLEQLWEAHLQYPNAVVAGRSHLITLDKDGHPNPYARWIHCTQGFESGPSMQLFAVGIGGVLYDPKLFPSELYNEESIRSLCLEADDLWLKAMELIAGVPVVRASNPELIQNVPGSQKTALYLQNQNQNRNDFYLSAILSHLTELYGKDIFAEQLNSPKWPRLSDDTLYDYLNKDIRKTLIGVNTAFDQLQKTLIALKSKQQSTEEKLKKTEDALSRSNQRADDLEKNIQAIRTSFSYRLGNKLVKPFNKLRSLIRR